MVTFDHVQVWLVAGDKRCPELVDDEELDDDQENNTFTRYAEVSSNQNWKIGIKLNKSFDWQFSQGVAARLFVDGKRVTTTRFSRPKGRTLEAFQSVLDGMRDGHGDKSKYLKFRFADLETSKWSEFARMCTDG